MKQWRVVMGSVLLALVLLCGAVRAAPQDRAPAGSPGVCLPVVLNLATPLFFQVEVRDVWWDYQRAGADLEVGAEIVNRTGGRVRIERVTAHVYDEEGRELGPVSASPGTPIWLLSPGCDAPVAIHGPELAARPHRVEVQVAWRLTDEKLVDLTVSDFSSSPVWAPDYPLRIVSCRVWNHTQAAAVEPKLVLWSSGGRYVGTFYLTPAPLLPGEVGDFRRTVAGCAERARALSYVPDCRAGSPTLQSTKMARREGVCIAEFDAIPNDAATEGGVGLSSGPATTPDDLAAVVRFHPYGYIDAWNGDMYQADTWVPYVPAKTYHFRLEIDVPARTYNIYVTPEGSYERVIGRDYAFSGGQRVSSLDHWAIWAGSGSLNVCYFVVTSSS